MLKKTLIAVLVIGLSAAVFVYYSLNNRPGQTDLGLTLANQIEPEPGDITIRWWGVSTLLIDDGETQILIDGFISRPGLLDIVLDRPFAPNEEDIADVLNDMGVQRLQAVTAVHSHFDHGIDVGVIANITGASVIGSASTANIARGEGVAEAKIIEAKSGEPFNFGAFTVKLIESRHAPLSNGGPPTPGTIDSPLVPPQPISTWREGGSYSIVVEHPHGSLLVQGSAGFLPGALDDVKVDAVFLGAGGIGSLPRAYFEQYVYEVASKTEPQNVYLIHHDDLTAPFGKLEMLPSLAYDQNLLFELEQLVLPARLWALEFDQAIVLNRSQND